MGVWARHPLFEYIHLVWRKIEKLKQAFHGFVLVIYQPTPNSMLGLPENKPPLVTDLEEPQQVLIRLLPVSFARLLCLWGWM